MKKSKSKAVDTVYDYIAGFPEDVQDKLEKVRAAIRKAAPAADELISYRIPAFKLNGPLLYFAAFKAHIGLYPVTESTKKKFKTELADYAQSKGTVRIPLDKPVPAALIGRIAKFKAKENAERDAAKAKKRKPSK